MVQKPIFWVSLIDGSKYSYEKYLNIETAGFQRFRNQFNEWVNDWKEPLPKHLYPYTLEYEIKKPMWK